MNTATAIPPHKPLTPDQRLLMEVHDQARTIRSALENLRLACTALSDGFLEDQDKHANTFGALMLPIKQAIASADTIKGMMNDRLTPGRSPSLETTA